MYEPPAPRRSSSEHRDVRLQVALARGRDAARGEQRVADDQPGGDALVHVAADAAVVVGEAVEREVLDEAVEPDGDARRPLEALGRDLAGDRVGARVGEVEQLADLLALALDRGGVGRLDARDEVVDLEHLDVRARLRVHLGEVRVHVEHPRVGVAEEAEARGAQAAHGARRRRPTRGSRPRRGRRRAACR